MRSDFAFGGGADGSGMMDVEADMISEGVWFSIRRIKMRWWDDEFLMTI
jgi:hypothetical protein